MRGKIVWAVMALFTALSCGAEKYQIKCLNTPTITIDGKQLKAGDWFNDNAKIQWEKDTQAMRVLSEKNRVYTISAKSFRTSKKTTLGDFLTSKKNGSSRGRGGQTLRKDLQDVFENEFEILDELHIDLSEVDDLPYGITFIISSNDSAIQPLSLKPENGVLIVNRNEIEPMAKSEAPYPLIVKFILPDSDEEILVTDWFKPDLLPI